MSDALLLLLRVNLAASAALAVVLLLRRPVRTLFGARVAYGLWALVALAALAMLLPARVVVVSASAAGWSAQAAGAVVDAGAVASGLPMQTAPGGAAILCAFWLGGVAAAFAHLLRSQLRFVRAARMGRGGPAVVGVLRPRVVTPADFASRYTPREQSVVLAHEQTHIARQDSRINAVVALARCLNWFNPLVHVLAHYLRIDQELACDAQVVAAHPAVRRSYAEAMLKTQLAAQPLPLGCYWPAQSAHPLAERIGLLTRPAPGRGARLLGGGLVAALALGGAWTAWAARPVETRIGPAIAQAPGDWERRETKAALVEPTARAPKATGKTRAHRTEAPSPPAAPLTPVVLRLPDPPPLTPAPPPPSADHGPLGVAERLLAPGVFGPGRIRSAASWSSVEPGSAVRVLATMTDPEGIPLVTDLTAFGSQSRYRVGYVERNASRYKLFTRVEQHGDRLVVTAALNQSFQPMVSGTTELASGETGTIRLPNGMVATVTPTIRPETPEEIAEANRMRARYVRVDRVEPL
jgi:beta-lactamase regulating signal transducer with metallopeptidase domain